MTPGLDLPYEELLRVHRPRPIGDEVEAERVLALVSALLALPELDPAQQDFLELLTMLLHAHEAQQHPWPKLAPADLVAHLMDEHGLVQRDLVDVFGSQSTVSEVLSGRRRLNVGHIERLAERFAVPPGLFLSKASKEAG